MQSPHRWPPFHLTGIRPVAVARGTLDMAMPASPHLRTSRGEVARGVIAFVADAPLSSCVRTTFDPGTVASTAELSIDVFAELPVDGEIRCKARLVEAGSPSSSAAVLEDGLGRPLGSATCWTWPTKVEPADERARKDFAASTQVAHVAPASGEVLDASLWQTLGGLGVLERQIDGRLPLPPIAATFGVRPVAATEGQVRLELVLSPFMDRPVYGGIYALLASLALSDAAETAVAPGQTPRLISMRANYLRPVFFPETPRLVAAAKIVHRTRSFLLASAEVTTPEGKLISSANGTLSVRSSS